MAAKFREITKRAEDLIEQGHDADDAVNDCQSRVSAATAQVRAAQSALSSAMETDDEGNPRGDVQSAQMQLRMAQGQLAAGQRALSTAQERVAIVRSEKNRHIQTIEQHNRVGQENLKKVQTLQGSAFSSDAAPLAAGIVERLNLAEGAKARLLQSMGIVATADLQTVPELGVSDSYAGRGGNFSTIVLDGVASNAKNSAGGNEGVVSGWSGLGDKQNGIPDNHTMSGTAIKKSESPSDSNSAEFVGEQHNQMSDLRNQYLRDIEGNQRVANAVLMDDGLTTEDKRETLLGLRNELNKFQDELLNEEEKIKETNDVSYALKRDSTEQYEIGVRSIDETIENYRQNLRDRGVADGKEMDAFLNHERTLMREELSANIDGDLSKIYEPPDFDVAAASMPKEEAPKASVDSYYNQTHDTPIIPVTSAINREFLSLFPAEKRAAVDSIYETAPKGITDAVSNNLHKLNGVSDCKYSFNSDGINVKESCNYNYNENVIYMNEDMNKAEYAEVLQHETMHFLDHNRGWESGTPAFVSAIAADKAMYNLSTPEGNKRFQDMMDDSFSTGAAYDRNVSDILSGVFLNDEKMVKRYYDEGVARYQHSNDYWLDPRRENPVGREVYANCGAIQSAQHRISVNFIERWFPNIDTTFKNMYGI